MRKSWRCGPLNSQLIPTHCLSHRLDLWSKVRHCFGIYGPHLCPQTFCYLGDMLSVGDGCEITVTSQVKTAWNKFRELLSVLPPRHLSYKICGHVYSSYVRSPMHHASETWPLTMTNLQCNDRAMIRQICSIKPEDVATVRSRE